MMQPHSRRTLFFACESLARTGDAPLYARTSATGRAKPIPRLTVLVQTCQSQAVAALALSFLKPPRRPACESSAAFAAPHKHTAGATARSHLGNSAGSVLLRHELPPLQRRLVVVRAVQRALRQLHLPARNLLVRN